MARTVQQIAKGSIAGECFFLFSSLSFSEGGWLDGVISWMGKDRIKESEQKHWESHFISMMLIYLTRFAFELGWIGLICGIAISTFSKPLTLLIGLLITGVSVSLRISSSATSSGSYMDTD